MDVNLYGAWQAEAKKELAPFDDFLVEERTLPTGRAYVL
jgi:hypothetical protein